MRFRDNHGHSLLAEPENATTPASACSRWWDGVRKLTAETRASMPNYSGGLILGAVPTAVSELLFLALIPKGTVSTQRQVKRVSFSQLKRIGRNPKLRHKIVSTSRVCDLKVKIKRPGA